ncbi:VOC family protein [Shewanella rhizosphaerae]|uniref:VOC family protein n=1 Tax=Shewanella rhizosphaerae TaxID=2864207 RepID=UPI001C65E870|nr:VOC family protein [Shewanella rhizosphaerae]QYK12343.1 VOC family protein [Shewanella rhizosphaerae]
MLAILGIDHLVLRTTDLPAMLAFYRGVLGCTLERELPEEGLTQLRAGNALIDIVTCESTLGRLGGGPPQQDGRNVDHVCLLIEAMEEQALLDYLSEQGITTQGFAKRYGAQGFGRSLYINDPEGNVVELKLAKGVAKE